MATTSYGAAELQTALSNFQALLDPAERAALSTTPCQVSTSNVLDLVAEVDKRKSRFTVRKLGVRLQPFLESVQQFSAIVDTFIQADPTVAALVWGSVKFVLLFATNFTDYFEKIAKMYSELGYLCPLLDRYKSLFPESPKLGDLVLGFYAIVVDFSAGVLKFLRQNTLKQMSKALWKPFKDTYNATEVGLISQQEKIEHEIRLASESAAQRERLQMSLYRSESRQHRTRQVALWDKEEDRQVRLDIEEQERKHQRLLEAISNYDYKRAFHNLRSRRQRETSAWLDQLPEFKAWSQDSTSGGLWIHGKPGAGKSTLSTAAIDLLFEGRAYASRTSIAYFFCDFSEKRSLDLSTILASLFKQQLSQFSQTPTTILPKLERYFIDNYRNADIGELFSLLKEASKICGNTCLILDGIEEAGDDTAIDLVTGLVDLLQSCNVKVILSSRYRVSISEIAKDFQVLSLDKMKSRPDIAAYIQDQLNKRLKSTRFVVKDPTLVDEIQKSLSDGCEGMVLWISLQFDEICRQRNDRAIRVALTSLPRGLDATYARILSRVEEDRDPEIAYRIFQWLAKAYRPLKLPELQEAVAIEPGDRSWSECQGRLCNNAHLMLQNCGNLALHNDIDNTIAIAHKTVLDFLFSKLCPTRFRLVNSNVENYLAESCLTYLNFSDFETALTRAPTSSSNLPTALDASVSAWIPHMAGSGRASQLIQAGFSLMQSLRWQKEKPVITASQYLAVPEPVQVILTPLEQFNTKFCFLAYVVENWLNHTSGITSSRTKSWELFQGVVNRSLPFPHRKWGESLEELLENPKRLPYLSQSAWAIEHCHAALLETTLCAVKRENPSLEMCRYNSEPLMERSESVFYVCSKGSKPCLEVLLRYGVATDVNMRSSGSVASEPMTLLEAAAEGGHLAVVERLLAANAEVNVPTSDRTALQAAAGGGHLAVVERLLAANAEVNVLTSGRTALHAAAGGGHLAVVERLLAANAEVIVPTSGRTTLHAAAGGGHLAVVERLLAANADVNAAPGYFGQTALQAAAGGGYLAVVQRLLAANADVNAPASADYSRTALQAAAGGGHMAVVERLLAANADVNVPASGHRGQTALQAAAGGGHLAVVQRLLAANAEVNAAPSYFGRTALQAAAEGWHSEIEKLLRKASARE